MFDGLLMLWVNCLYFVQFTQKVTSFFWGIKIRATGDSKPCNNPASVKFPDKIRPKPNNLLPLFAWAMYLDHQSTGTFDSKILPCSDMQYDLYDLSAEFYCLDLNCDKKDW